MVRLGNQGFHSRLWRGEYSLVGTNSSACFPTGLTLLPCPLTTCCPPRPVPPVLCIASLPSHSESVGLSVPLAPCPVCYWPLCPVSFHPLLHCLSLYHPVRPYTFLFSHPVSSSSLFPSLPISHLCSHSTFLPSQFQFPFSPLDSQFCQSLSASPGVNSCPFYFLNQAASFYMLLGCWQGYN